VAVSERIARQLRQPSGPTGRMVGHLLNQLNRPINRSAVRRLQLDGAERVLEVGFGGGVALDLILNRTDGTVAGVETSNAMLARGRHRFRRQIERGRLELMYGGVSEIPYADERFDRVLSTHTMYFWPDPAHGLREIHRVLAPRGRVVVATECPEDLGRRSYARHGFRILRDHELEDLLSGAGYSEVAVQREGTRAFGSFVFAEGLKP
jgi:arsenite methyltransferase